ncbi:DUF6794 domain-containing protein [Candidatus Accumulibacter necessarius]|jgi:hypothetical protein|uniref:DUF6794 domain-containing protein n=1 Tax=Candidatus Accumulibacter necessarius TaxID=2954386 RepID=UPI003DA7E889
MATIAAMAKSELIGLHFGSGAWIRNNPGLWKGNGALLEAAGGADANDASMGGSVAASAGAGAESALSGGTVGHERSFTDKLP